MNPTEKTKAAELAIALEWGYATLPEAIEWADEQISNTDVPHDALFDLSLADGPNEAAGYLRALSEGTDRWLNLACFLCRFHSVETMNPQDASELAKHLYMATQNHDPPEPFRAFASHWDAIDLARDGSYGNVEDSITDFLTDIRKAIFTSDGAEC